MAAANKFSTDHFAHKLGLFYAAYFFFGGIQLPFFPLWLEASGLDARTIGFFIAVPVVIRIIAIPLITHHADKRRALKTALVATSVVGTLAMAAVGFAQGSAAMIVFFIMAAVAFSPVLSLTDAYALSGLPARGRAYGPVRLWGSAAFIAGNVLAGFFLERFAPGGLIWLIVGALALSAMAAVTLDPVDASDRPATQHPAKSPKFLLRNPAFIAIALASSMIQSSHALYYAFSTVQWRAAGFDGTLIGVLWGLGVVAEIALFALSGRFPHWAKPPVLMAIGGAGAVLRWTIMAFDPPIALLVPLQLLHAASFAAAHLGLMAFMAHAVPRELAATAQGFVATLSGVINASATLGSGFVYAAFASQAYLVMAAMGFVGLASAIYAGRCWHSIATQHPPDRVTIK